MTQVLIETRDLKTYFPILKGILRRPAGSVNAVDGINLIITRGQWLGLVGESGCGKTTLAKTIIRLLQPTSGNVYFDVPDNIKDEIDSLQKSNGNPRRLVTLRQEYDLSVFAGSRLQSLRRRMQLVHQDPYTSLNPRMKIKDIVAEPVRIHGLESRHSINKKVAEILNMVGISSGQLGRYPHQFSGGQRQRIAIARALSTNPDFIVFDEPTSALDVSVQAQILILLRQLKNEYDLTYLYITHDLIVAESVCDRIAVMYLGKIVEIGSPTDIFRSPRHPYTSALITATPIADPKRKRSRIVLPGEVPSPSNPPSGCRFHPRCTRAIDDCTQFEPVLEPDSAGHYTACWRPLN